MPISLFQYEMLPTTWFYVSAIIILATFFKFNRFWSVRNLDLICLILLTPGLLYIAGWDNTIGYTWLFCVQGFLVMRLLFDFIMVRRPLLEPNLSSEGLSFSCFFLIFFVIAALVVNRGEQINSVNTVRLDQILTSRHIHKQVGIDPETLSIPPSEWNNLPPGFPPFLALTEHANLVFAPPKRIQAEIIKAGHTVAVPLYSYSDIFDSIPSNPADTLLPSTFSPSPVLGIGENNLGGNPSDGNPKNSPPAISPHPIAPHPIAETTVIRSTTEPVTIDALPPIVTDSSEPESPPLKLDLLAILFTLLIGGHLLIALGFVYVGYRHFGQVQTGIACAALYLLHPYSTQMIGRLDHVIPTALILWGVGAYHRPFLSGLCIGTAGALIWYPLCLLPLWCGFYKQKGWKSFLAGAVLALLTFAILLCFSHPGWGTFGEQFLHFSGKTAFIIYGNPDGFWTADDRYFRMPILALFVVVCVGSFFIPVNKHLATLIAGSALLMLGTQFFILYQGGLYLSWYLPLLVLTIFRPNLEDRTATAAIK